ncbi:tRNA1(Val) (adenine(37)-N6)-methyltransferase [Halalkalibacillus halophilus]|uniref:tRNA1(Val) (adenine(37)-N6)-methyltransferase n=1 Tax=Halalkalibacillus halophilus TaxID=392827 RepID=UPI00041A6E15|nr:tRNA1(Val) (adenine(37)-N6)-methyltransferase [Halalkalibacillus halophilus]
MTWLKDDERIDYLLADQKRRIIQSPSVFAFSADAVLLAHFTYLPIKKGKIIDLCTGNGVIPLFLSKRSQVEMVGVEIQERLFDMAKRNVSLNGLEEQIKIVHEDLKVVKKQFPHENFDLVTCNPPYFKEGTPDKMNINEHLRLARHEILCDLEDVLKASSQLVKSGGKVSLVHRPERLSDMFHLSAQFKLEPKRIQLVYPKQTKEANMLLIEFVKDGQSGLKVEPPIFIHEENGDYTEEMTRILYGEEGTSTHGAHSEKL